MARRGYGPTVRLPNAPRPHPNKPIRQNTPTIVHGSCLWSPLEAEMFSLRMSGPEIGNSGRLIRLFDLLDPHYNKKADAGWALDVEWLVMAGYKLFFVKKVDVCFTIVPTDTSYVHGINKMCMMMVEGDQPIPSPEVRWQFFQYVYPIMKTKTILSAYSGSKPTTLRMSFLPSYAWPYRSAFEDDNNWGIFPLPGAPGSGTSPVRENFLWYGVASTLDTQTQNATYYAGLQIRLHYVAVKDQVNTLLPTQVPSDAFIPADEWQTLEGMEPAADANEGPGAAGYEGLDQKSGGVAADLSAVSSTYLPQWYNDAP